MRHPTGADVHRCEGGRERNHPRNARKHIGNSGKGPNASTSSTCAHARRCEETTRSQLSILLSAPQQAAIADVSALRLVCARAMERCDRDQWFDVVLGSTASLRVVSTIRPYTRLALACADAMERRDRNQKYGVVRASTTANKNKIK